MSKKNKGCSLHRRQFMLTFFKQEADHNEAITVNGFVLYKHPAGMAWTVDLMTPESYQAFKERRSRPIQEEKLF